MIVYEIRTGKFSKDDICLNVGLPAYSGFGPAKNDPACTALPNVGPLPEGLYAINPPRDSALHGPYVLALTPDPKNVMYGRADFLIHGEHLPPAKPGQASRGCIVASKVVRARIYQSGVALLKVISGDDVAVDPELAV